MVALSAACFREHQFASSIEVHMKLIDTPNSVIGKVAKLKGLGVSGIIRYVSPNTASFPNKRVTASEIRECARFGVWVGLVWEVAGTASEMSAAIGKVHAGKPSRSLKHSSCQKLRLLALRWTTTRLSPICLLSWPTSKQFTTSCLQRVTS